MRTYQPVTNHEDLLGVVDGLLEEIGLDRSDTGGSVTFAGLDPLRPTVLKTGAASAAIAATNSIASAILWRHRGGEGQDIHVDLRKAFAYQSPWQDVLAGCTTLNGHSINFDPYPLLQLVMLGVLGVADCFQQTRIAPDATTILGRAGAFPRETERVALPRLQRQDFFHEQLVLPAIPEIVFVSQLVLRPGHHLLQ